MFEVICINNKDHANKLCPKIQVGDRVTVIAERMFEGLNWYEFREYPPRLIDFEWWRIWYAAKNFATLPEQSADEVNEREQEAIIYQR